MDHNAIYFAYPQVVRIDDSLGAFDAEGNLVELDEKKIKAAAQELTAKAAALKAEQEAKKAAALAKLEALGFTEEEFKTLFV